MTITMTNSIMTMTLPYRLAFWSTFGLLVVCSLTTVITLLRITSKAALGSHLDLNNVNNNNLLLKNKDEYQRKLDEFTLERKQLYQHQPSLERIDDERYLCGSSPDFEQYFALNHTMRSSSKEDKNIYEIFFKQPNTKTAIGPEFHYLELGAYDGRGESNTRFFDICLGWNG
jgi:hypothetical protein